MIQKLLHSSIEKLQNAGIISARLDTELLLSFVIGKNREFIITHPEYVPEKKQISTFKKLINKRTKLWPIAYLIGYKEFYGLNFNVNKYTLVPRPETEILVDEALKIAKINPRATIIDIGTGSGCIITALANNLGKNYKYHAIDISKKALETAKQNAIDNNVDFIIFTQANLLTKIYNRKLDIKTLIITANLPYLTPEQTDNEPSISKEPRLALVSGADGLKHYRQLFAQIKKLQALNPQLNIYIFSEINPEQAENFNQITTRLFTSKTSFINDLTQRTRFALTILK